MTDREKAKEFIVQSVKDDVDIAKVADAIKALEDKGYEQGYKAGYAKGFEEGVVLWLTKEEAIRELKAMYEHILPHMSIMGTEAFDLAIKALEQAKWIPVSERLPEDNIHVLCQFYLGGMGECYLAHGVFHVVGGVVMTCNEVIAWMPLPEPYKAESEEVYAESNN